MIAKILAKYNQVLLKRLNSNSFHHRTRFNNTQLDTYNSMFENRSSFYYQSGSLLLNQSTFSQSSAATFESFSSEIEEQYSHQSFLMNQEKCNAFSNAQGQIEYLERGESFHFQENEIGKFNQFLVSLSQRDFSGLFEIWSYELVQKLNFILQNWKAYAPDVQESFKKLVTICRMFYLSSLANAEIYPGLNELCQNIAKKLGLRQSNQPLPRQSNPNNIYFNHFINQIKTKAGKDGALFFTNKKNNSRISLGDYIVKHNLFKQNREVWKKLFFITQAHRKYNYAATSNRDMQEQITSVYQFARLSCSHHELTQPCDRICCAKFFYLDFNICPIQYMSIICRPKVEVLKAYQNSKDKKEKKKNQPLNELQAIKKASDELEEVCLDVCGLLNSGGGVILFNIEQKYLEMRPFGDSMIEDEKKRYRQIVREGLERIQPAVQMEKQIIISFVPLAKHPYEYGYIEHTVEEEDRRINRLYVEGLYVMRIAVLPSQSSQLYYYSSSSGTIKSATIRSGQREFLKGEQMVIEMKRKYQFFSEQQEQDEQVRQLVSKDFSYFERGHRCVEPYQGKVVHKKEDSIEQQKPEFQFKNMSLMIAPNDCFQIIKKRLERKGIKIKLYTAFQKLNFKAAVHSVPIFYDIQFKQMLNEVSYKEEFKFQDKYMLIIKVTKYLKLISRRGENYLPKVDFITLQRWLQSQFPGQKLRYFTFQSMDQQNQRIIQHYLLVPSKLSTVYVYYVLHHHDQKALFKNPNQQDQSLVELQKRLREVYPTNCRQPDSK